MLQIDFKILGDLPSPEQEQVFKFRPVLKADCFKLCYGPMFDAKVRKRIPVQIYLDSYSD